jgi:hypothetical protein
MGLLDKMKSPPERGGSATAVAAAPAENTRGSNGLKDFLWLLGDVQKGQLLDLGPVSQATVSFFTGLGFKVYTEDVLRSWREYLNAQEEKLRRAPPGQQVVADPITMAEEFLAQNLRFTGEQFHAVLAWDLFDYLDAELLPRAVARLHSLLRNNGVLLGIFHQKTPEKFLRYRVLDKQTIELVPAIAPHPPQRFLQNRDILNLFSAFKSSKTYVARDQNREGLFTK